MAPRFRSCSAFYRKREMVRCMSKCRRFAEVAVMEVTQVVGVRTRARSLALAAASDGLSQKRRKEDGSKDGAYLQLRSRSLVMTHRFSKSACNSDATCCGSVDQGRISRCSSISSCEQVEEDVVRYSTVNGQKSCEENIDLGSSMCHFECNNDRRDIFPSSFQITNSSELESSEERESWESTDLQFTMPFVAEIEEFLAAGEKYEKQRFATKYNFDVDNELPLEGRYEWVRINQ